MQGDRPFQGSITLRPATPDDDAFLLEVYGSTRSELDVLGWSDSQKQAFCSMQFMAQNRSYPKAADNRIIVLNDRPIGRMLVETRDEAVVLIDIALLAQNRSAGIGGELIRGLQEKALAQRKPIRLHVLASNPAIRLYERLGFSISGGDAVYLEMTWTPSGDSGTSE